MSIIPKGLKFSKRHVWMREDDIDNVTIGITDHAQYMLGDVLFVDLPNIGEYLTINDVGVELDAARTTMLVYAPLSGDITDVNDALFDNPRLVNIDPYGKGWLLRMHVLDEDIGSIYDAAEYAKIIAKEAN